MAVPDLHSRKPGVKGALLHSSTLVVFSYFLSFFSFAPFLFGIIALYRYSPGSTELVEPYLPENYRACEIFGRNLTEGWFTWGDEAIKFNWDGHWKPEAENITTTAAATATAADAAAVNGNGNGNGNGDEIRDDEMTDE